ncbi:hypothetical protein, partial [Stenotrophomonas sp. 3diitr2024]|uniref:hypothetical protein n=1 Tax=Stenotrophomonas sp. 3diitr2024 TaxID=3345115 RepID=UPI0035CA8ABD
MRYGLDWIDKMDSYAYYEERNPGDFDPATSAYKLYTPNYFRFELQGDYTQNMLKVPEWNLARYNQDGNWAGGRLLNGL